MAGWTTTETFTFIELYKKEACIWNPENKYHKDKIKVNDAWVRIADVMGVPVTEAKKKKETLLSGFRLNHKKVLASLKSGSGEDESFKPQWLYYDALAAFMSDVYECKSILSTEEYVEDESLVVGSPSNSQGSDELSAEEEDEHAAQTTPRASIPVDKRPSHNKHLDSQETNAQVINVLSTLNNVLSDIRKNQCEDDCDLYGRLLAKKLRQYAEIDKLDLMYEIDGLLLKKRRSLDGDSS